MSLGLGLGINKYKKVASGFDSNYQAVLDYQETQGYSQPSEPVKIAQNQMISSIGSAIWAKMDGFVVFATDGDEDAAYTDWVRLSQLSKSGSVQFSTQKGVTSDGSTGYINTNWQYQDGPNTAVALSDDNFYILGLRLNPAGDIFGEPGNSVMRLYWAGAGLNATEASDFYDHWQTYLTDAGA